MVEKAKRTASVAVFKGLPHSHRRFGAENSVARQERHGIELRPTIRTGAIHQNKNKWPSPTAAKTILLLVAGSGVERICKVLQVAPSTYYTANGRPASARQRRDAEIAPLLLELWESNYPVYGVRKLWKAAQRADIQIGRDQVARLMKVLEIDGVCREKRVM